MKDNTRTPSKGRQRLKSAMYTLLPLITIVVFILIWALLNITGAVDDAKVPPPWEVFKAFIFKLSNTGPDGALLITNVLASLQVTLTGLVLAIGIGVPLGVIMGWYRLFDKFIRPLFEILRPIPPVAWIPLMILWAGVGLGAKSLIIFISAFVPCVINSYTGVRQTNPTLINVAKTFGAKDFYIFINIGIPSAVPMIFAGMRVSFSSAWATLVAAEMLAASSGLGYMINMARNFGRIDVVVLGMLCIGILGTIFNWLFGRLEKLVLKGRAV